MKHRLPVFSCAEPLEPRIAPAAVFSFTDVDGDQIVVRTSKGTNDQLAGAVKLVASGAGQQLREIDFSTVPLVGGVNPFAGTTLTVSVVSKAPSGDGRVNVGYIDASTADGAGMDGAGLPLGRVKISGDLGQIDVSVAAGSSALAGLTAASIGTFGVATQGANGSTASNIVGNVGKIKVTGDMRAVLSVTGSSGGLSVGGALAGAGVSFTGASGAISLGSSVQSGITGTTATKISVRGGVIATGDFLNFSDTLPNVKIGGDLTGANIRGVEFGRLFIGGDVRGQSIGSPSANIVATANIGTLIIGGSFVAADASSSAVIDVAGNLGKLRIGGSMVAPVASDLRSTGAAVFVDGNVGSIVIGGDILGPQTSLAGSNERVDSSSSIRVGGDVGSLAIIGSVIGFGGIDNGSSRNLFFTASHFGSVSIGGELRGFGASIPSFLAVGGDGRPAVGSFTVTGSMIGSRIIGGLQDIFVNVPRNADAILGTIVVRGDLADSTIETGFKAAGVTDSPNRTGTLMKLQVGGTLTDASSVRVEEIVRAKVGGNVLRLTPGKSNDTVPIIFRPGTANMVETA